MREDWALCVGIGAYGAGTKLAPLPGALNDAETIYRWLIDPGGGDVPKEQAHLILSPKAQADGTSEPTAERIEKFLRKLVLDAGANREKGEGFRVGRRLWLFYSGHGIGFPEQKETGLLAADAFPPVDVPHVAGTAWARAFQVSGAFDEVVLLMDCCRTETNLTSPRAPSVQQPKSLTPGRMMAAFAAGEGAASYEITWNGQPRGKFAVAVEELLKNPPENPLYARRFLDYLEQKYPDASFLPPASAREDFVLLGGLAGPLTFSLLSANGGKTARSSAWVPFKGRPVKTVPASRDAKGCLVVKAQDPLSYVRLWDAHGHSMGTGYGSLMLDPAPTGRYSARASLGAHHSEGVVEVTDGSDTILEIPPLALRLPRDLQQLELVDDAVSNATGRRLVCLALPDDAPKIILSIPKIAGWRMEAFVPPKLGSSALSLRMVPESLAAGAPYATDALRESLRLALADPGWAGVNVPSADVVAADPIAALLAAALLLRGGLPHDAHVAVAAVLLGDRDEDVCLLRGAATLRSPPLLSFPWHFRLRAEHLTVEKGSVAERLAARQRLATPWLAWGPEEGSSARSWLTNVANAVWPGWDADPSVDLALPSLDAAAASLGAPPSSVRALTYKSPPVDRLVQHERVAFVGASNDQLPAALAVAFVERGRRKWAHLEILSLEDGPLSETVSAGRTGPELVRARNRAEARLRELLSVVAAEGSMARYSGLKIDGVAHFASLWDWEAPNGYVHVSPCKPGDDVRVAKQQNLVWSASQPSEDYARAVKGFQEIERRQPSNQSANTKGEAKNLL